MSRVSYAWSCAALSRLFQGAEKSMSSLSSSWEAEFGCSRGRWSGLRRPGPSQSPIICCQSFLVMPSEHIAIAVACSSLSSTLRHRWRWLSR